MVFEKMKIDVYAREHANMDSFPFRFGFHYSKNTELEIYEIKDREAQPKGKQKFRAKFLDPSGDEHEGTFVLLSTWSKNLKLVTVWRNDQESEFYLSELMTNLRKSGRIDVNDLLDLHPRYIKGELSTMDALFNALLKKKSELSQFDYASLQAKIQEDYIKQIEHLESENKNLKSENNWVRKIAKTAIDGLKDEENKNNLLQSELAEYKRENARASSARETATLSQENRCLAEVNRSIFYRGSSCTELVFTDGTRKYMKTSTFDRDLFITQKAEQLIGSVVRTTCWDPVYEPGKWSSQGYFRGIYAVKE